MKLRWTAAIFDSDLRNALIFVAITSFCELALSYFFRKHQAETLIINSLFSDRQSAVDPYFPGVGFMVMLCSLAIHFAGSKCWARYSI